MGINGNNTLDPEKPMAPLIKQEREEIYDLGNEQLKMKSQV